MAITQQATNARRPTAMLYNPAEGPSNRRNTLKPIMKTDRASIALAALSVSPPFPLISLIVVDMSGEVAIVLQ
jgi:hypothetical protein